MNNQQIEMQKEIIDSIDGIYFRKFNNSNNNDQGDVINGETTTSSQSANSHQSNDASDEFLDTSEFELKKLNIDETCKSQIESRLKKLESQKDSVGRQVSEIIFQNSQAYSNELVRVSEFKLLLEDSFQICTIARRALNMSELMFVLPSLKLMKKQMKKMHLIQLYKTINQIKAFNNSTNHIVELIKNKEFPKAIHLCQKSEKEMSKYEHLKCILDLKKRVISFYDVIEENLELNLGKICRHYDETMFGRIFNAYSVLEKIDNFLDKLHINMLSCINHIASEALIGIIVNAFVVRENLTTNSKENLVKVNLYIEELKKKEFSHLFSLIFNEDYKLSLIHMCLNLWQGMKNYYKMCVFISNSYTNKLNSKIELNNDNNNNYDASHHTKVEVKLNVGISKLWLDIQQKLSSFFRSMNFENYKFDEFIDILTIINQFIELGHEFCNKNSDNTILIEAAKDQTLAYFKAYHMLHLEEMKMFLENETWQWCPVKSDFSIYKLQEYKFLNENSPNRKEINKLEKINLINEIHNYTTAAATAAEESIKANSVNKIEKLGKKFELNSHFVDLMKIENPFSKDKHLNGAKSMPNGNINDRSSIERDENKNILLTNGKYGSADEAYVGNGHGHNQHNSEFDNDHDHDTSMNGGLIIDKDMPILTNTTLNIIRLFGKYIHILSIFKIISHQVTNYLMQLFYFYLYFIYTDFSQELDRDASRLNDSNSSLQTIIKNIKNELFSNSNFIINEPRIHSIKMINNRDDYLSCINQRIVAAESIIFLAKQIEELLPLIESFLPENCNSTQKSYFSNSVSILKEIPKIRTTMYFFVSNLAVDWNQMFELISRVNWDLNDILSQHNTYVDIILRHIQKMIGDVESLHDQLPLNKNTIHNFVREALRLLMRKLVDGYALVKKCSNEGRALMQLDFQQLIVKLEKLCDIRPVPDKDYVEAYIKAFYLPDSSIEKWIKDHPEYQQKHITSLLNVMAQVTKKTRTSILASFGN